MEKAMAHETEKSWTGFARTLGRLSGATAGRSPAPLDDEDERTLACLGASVILHWANLDRNLQRSLFEAALAASQDPDERGFRHHLALVLHEHHPRTSDQG
jgi:hypothetical protein